MLELDVVVYLVLELPHIILALGYLLLNDLDLAGPLDLATLTVLVLVNKPVQVLLLVQLPLPFLQSP